MKLAAQISAKDKAYAEVWCPSESLRLVKAPACNRGSWTGSRLTHTNTFHSPRAQLLAQVNELAQERDAEKRKADRLIADKDKASTKVI